MGRLSDLEVEFGKEGAQKILDGLRLGSGDVLQGLPKVIPRKCRLLALEELAHGGRDDFGPVAEAIVVLGQEGVNPGDDVVLQRDARPSFLSHCPAQGITDKEPVPLEVRGSPRNLYGSGPTSGLAAQAEGSKFTMPRTSLPVVSPSSARLEPYTDETTKAPTGLPDAARTHSERRAGSTSKEMEYGVCRHCNRHFLLRRDAAAPRHHSALVAHRGPHPICPGSGEAPGSWLGA